MVTANIKTGLIIATASAAVFVSGLPQIASAKSASSSLGVRLIIEPDCPLNAAGNVSRQRVPTENRARRIARGVLRQQGVTDSSTYGLQVRHYRIDTGQWEVTQIWADEGETADALILLIDKCSGEVSRL